MAFKAPEQDEVPTGAPARPTDSGTSGVRRWNATAPRRRRRMLLVGLGGVAISALIAFAIGFAHFVHTVATLEKPDMSQTADAIVVLTGGSERINDAVTLLDQGRAERLLISGVHPGTSRETLADMTTGSGALFACCVDLGHAAMNTVGNAKEARNWARGNGFESLIVVTSSYHLPRSLNEIRRAMPEANLIPYPVIAHRVALDDWWKNPGTTRLMLAEYTKYLMSIIKLRVSGPAISYETAQAAISR